MADQDASKGRDPEKEPKVRDKRKIDPATGEPKEPTADATRPDEPTAQDIPDAPVAEPEQAASESQEGEDDAEFSEADLELLAQTERDLVAEYRDRAARAEAELRNFRTRVERDRAANREAVIAEVIRSLLPAIDDLDRAEAHGDLEGSPLAIVAQKLRAGFERYGLTKVGEKGEAFDPKLHEALVQSPSPDVEVNTVADVIEPGYRLGERLLRAAKVAVSVPQP